MDVTAITRRKDAILTSIISQVTPSESSLIKRIGWSRCSSITCATRSASRASSGSSMHEPLTNLRKVIVIVCERDMPPTEVWRALYGAARAASRRRQVRHRRQRGHRPDQCRRAAVGDVVSRQPDLDLQMLQHRDQGHGPRSLRNGGEDASVLIDATLKEDFPPISLPKREYMERAKEIWEELGLPKLKPEAPWFGYSLGEWSPEFDAAALRATRGDYFENGKGLEKRRRKDVRMNTEVRRVKEKTSAPKATGKPAK